MTRTHHHARLVAALLFAVLLVLPATASASTVLEYQIQYEPAADVSLLVVTAVADPQSPLPITVTVPVPAGATLLWAGEVLGGPTANDPTRETAMETVDDMDVYTMTIEQAYTAQLELQLPAASASGSRQSAAMTWTNPGDEVPVRASIIVPAGATDVEVSPPVGGEIDTNAEGQTLYPLTGGPLAQGDSMVIEASWATGAAAAAEGQADSTILPVLLGLLVLAVVALVIVVVRERTRARRGAVASAGR
ncbi:MAG: hypothetical protein WBJ62_04410 [Coriobacteriia bacterium]